MTKKGLLILGGFVAFLVVDYYLAATLGAVCFLLLLILIAVLIK